MPPLPSRKSLESMKRADLQSLCKEYGVRANLKTEALIELLLETQSAPPPSPMRRSVSTTRQPSRTGPSRTTSLIIHDIEEEKAPDAGTMSEEPGSVLGEERSEAQPPQPVRTRKAKELQTRLGVGRPKVAGGSGPRVVTKSMSVPRGRRGKSSRMMSKVEATIEEEEEPLSSGPIPIQSEVPAPDELVAPIQYPSTTLSTEIAEHIANAIRPLQVKVEGLEEELRNTQRLNQELERIKVQLATLENLQQRYDVLEAEVREMHTETASIASLAEEFKHLKENMSANPSPPPVFPSTPKPKSPRLPLAGGLGLGFPSAFKTMGFPPSMPTTSPTEVLNGEGSSNPPPGASSTMLGKRPRSSSASNLSGVIEGHKIDLSEKELAHTIFRPTKKRAKLSSSEARTPVAGPSKPTTSEVAAQLLAPRLPSFTIFQGPDSDYSAHYLDDIDAPPTHPLPEVYRPSTPPGGPFVSHSRTAQRATSSASNEENQQHPFDFSFFPISSNGHDSFMQPIPFPDPPQSPSPTSNAIGFLNQLQDGRTDPFKEFGFPSPKRPRLLSSAGESSSRQASGKQREVTSNEIAAGLGLTMVRTGSPGLPDAPPIKKTMYGTEMEEETRFGDFGVKGVASGFWSTR